ncbi:MAG: branched-chain amino acid ABC transporter substrate-binding protein [Caldilineaceae bacterium]|nr:branched-chain amino acid ABC transporter substrate-binding protein [Caldilineaceae bacterium]
MSKIRLLTLAFLFAIALLAVLGLAANPVAQPQQASALAGRVAALETAVVEQTSLTQALATRVSRLETEVGLAAHEATTATAVSTAVPATVSTAVSTTDWVTVTSETKRYTYQRAPDWVVMADTVETLAINLQMGQFLYFSIDNSLEYLVELQGDEAALQAFAEEFTPPNAEAIDAQRTESKQFKGAPAVLWEMTYRSDAGDTIRQLLAYYQCEEDSACLIVLVEFESDPDTSPEGWALLETIANGITFLAGPVVHTSTFLRDCPSSDCKSTSMIQKGQGIEIIAQSSDGKWYQLDSGEWLSANVVRDAPGDLPVDESTSDVSAPDTAPVTTAPITSSTSTPITDVEPSPIVVKVATQSPLTGPQSLLGTAIRNGAELAIEQLAGDLTRMGATVELVPFDDQSNRDIGVANAKQLVADPAILCMVGHLNSAVLLPSMETYHDAGLAVVSPANTFPEVTDTGYPEINRIIGRDDVQGAAAQRFASEYLGAKSVYILYENYDYGQRIAEFFRQAAEGNNMEVLGSVQTNEYENFSALIEPILAAQPDLVYFGGIYDQAGTFFGQARAAGVTAAFMGPDGMDSSDTAARGGEGIVGLSYTTMAAPVDAYPDSEEFAQDYADRFGEEAQPFAAEGYDATGVCLEGVARTLEANGGVLPTRAQVAEAVRHTTDYPGITGTISFNAKGDRVSAAYFVLEVQSSDPDLWNQNEIVETLWIDNSD